MNDPFRSLRQGGHARRLVDALLQVAFLTALLTATPCQAQQIQYPNPNVAPPVGVPAINTAQALGPHGQVQIANNVYGRAGVTVPVGPTGLAYSKQFGMRLSV